MFKVGQKVVCVDDSVGKYIKKKPFKKGEIYTVTNVCQYEEALGDIEVNSMGFWSNKERFRPLDFNFGEVVAEHIEQQINEEQLIKAK